jgi:hypothetical protein
MQANLITSYLTTYITLFTKQYYILIPDLIRDKYQVQGSRACPCEGRGLRVQGSRFTVGWLLSSYL